MTSIMPADFWSSFAKNHWEQEALAVPGPYVEPPTNPDAVFQMMLAQPGYLFRVRFYLGGQEQDLKTHPEYLPQSADGSFAGYSERIGTMTGGREYVFVADGFTVDEPLFDWTQRFLSEMAAAVGHQTWGHFWSVFYGNYTSTPFGVHDHQTPPESAFYFPLSGRKAMRIWKPEYVKQHPTLKGSTKFDEHLAASTLLEAEAGGLLYWPSNRWHVGDSRGGDVSIVLAVACPGDLLLTVAEFLDLDLLEHGWLRAGIRNPAYVFRLARAWTHMNLHRLLKRRGWRQLPEGRRMAEYSCAPENLQKEAEELPAELREVMSVFRSIWDPEWLELVVSTIWLQALTARGLVNTVLFTAVDSTSTVVRGAPGSPIVWRRFGRDRLAVGHRGTVLDLPWSPGIPSVIERLNSGVDQSLAELRSLVCGNQEASALDAMLSAGFVSAPER